MLSILILANSLDGLFSFRKEVIKAIVDAGHHVFISSPLGDEKKGQYFCEYGCELIPTQIERRGTNPIKDIQLIKTYSGIIRKIRPSVILTYTIKPNIYGGIAARLFSTPQLANITGLGTAVENHGILQLFSVFLYKFGLKKAKTVFYQNANIKEFCSDHHIGKHGISLPGSGVDLSWHTLQDYPEKDKPLRFLFIGRIMKDKGINEFLSMAKTIQSKYANIEFYLLGGCEEHYENILHDLQEQGIVHWFGPVSDVRPYIKDACCTIHPSYHEGMANVLLETCAAGRPVITTDINGCKEAVDDGINGFLCRVADADDLAAKVEKFINLPYEERKKMGIAARKKVEGEFDRQIVIDAYLDEIKKAQIPQERRMH